MQFIHMNFRILLIVFRNFTIPTMDYLTAVVQQMGWAQNTN